MFPYLPFFRLSFYLVLSSVPEKCTLPLQIYLDPTGYSSSVYFTKKLDIPAVQCYNNADLTKGVESETMKKIEQSLHIHFAFALAWSILMVLGIPMIICGAAKPAWLPLPTLFFVLGIAFSGGGFYGVPILWVTYGAKRELHALVYAVEVLGLRDVAALSSHLRKPAEEVRTKLDTCLSKGYFPCLYRDGDRLVEPAQNRTPQMKSTMSSVPAAARALPTAARGAFAPIAASHTTQNKNNHQDAMSPVTDPSVAVKVFPKRSLQPCPIRKNTAFR